MSDDWRAKCDEDLTLEDLAEMRRLAVSVAVTGPPCDICRGSGYQVKSLSFPPLGSGQLVQGCPNGCPRPVLRNANS